MTEWLCFHKKSWYPTSSAPNGEIRKIIDFHRLADIISGYHYIVAITGRISNDESSSNNIKGAREMNNRLAYTTIWRFWRQPAEIWEILCDLRKEIDSSPTTFHYALAKLEQYYPLKVIITENIYQTHQRAGSSNVIEYDGNIMEAVCSTCNASIEISESLIADPFFSADLPPRCNRCFRPLKPNLLLLGEKVPKISTLADNEVQKCDLLIIFGTLNSNSGICNLPLKAKRRGAIIVEVNEPSKALPENLSNYLIDDTVDGFVKTVRLLCPRENIKQETASSTSAS